MGSHSSPTNCITHTTHFLSTMNSKLKIERKNNKNWIHNPEKLLNGHVVYLIKFLGDITVNEAKGLEVVKQSVQKLQFNQELKKAESNFKMGEAELTISVNGVTIQDPKCQKVLYEYSLDSISYYVDDKVEKQGFFSFISSSSNNDEFNCFVFLSNKLAKDVTLTLAQAFDLAYVKSQDEVTDDATTTDLNILIKKIQVLEHENAVLKKRMKDVVDIKGKNKEVKQYMKENDIVDLCTLKPLLISTDASNIGPRMIQDENPMKENENSLMNDEEDNTSQLICFDESFSSTDEVNDNDFYPRAWESSDSSTTPNDVSLPNDELQPNFSENSDFFGMASFSEPVAKNNLYPALDDLNPFKNF